jgi:hypothetical protein
MKPNEIQSRVEAVTDRLIQIEGQLQRHRDRADSLDAQIGDLAGGLSRVVSIITNAMDADLADSSLGQPPPEALALISEVRELKSCLDVIMSERRVSV